MENTILSLYSNLLNKFDNEILETKKKIENIKQVLSENFLQPEICKELENMIIILEDCLRYL